MESECAPPKYDTFLLVENGGTNKINYLELPKYDAFLWIYINNILTLIATIKNEVR